MAPLSSLSRSEMRLREGIRPIASGISPLRLFLCSMITSRFVHPANSAGIEPESALLSSHRVRSSVQFPRDAGMDPEIPVL